MPSLPSKPLNREPPLQDLISSFLTPSTIAYDRNHGPHPSDLDAATHRVQIDGLVTQPLSLSLSDLEQGFSQHDVVCALQCAGNRRHTMRSRLKEVQGIDWADGAVMNCRWTGPLLRDVLLKAGLAVEGGEGELHVAFASLGSVCEESSWYGASIPLARAMREDAEVVLALKMNGEPLDVKHGYPVRVIAPGIAGARAVKWLDRVTVQREESENHYMQFDYKVLPPEAENSESASRFWSIVPPIIDMPVNSAIAVPAEGSTVERDRDGCVTVQGYALPSGEDGPVIGVEVSADGGQGWTAAECLHHQDEGKWSWTLWRCRLAVPPGRVEVIYSRATDAAGNRQPHRSRWNLRGMCYNGYGEVAEITVK